MTGQGRCKDVYGEPIMVDYPNSIIRVYKPILTDEERARRMKAIEKAMIDLLLPSIVALTTFVGLLERRDFALIL